MAYSFSTSRVVALATVAGALTLGFGSGAFGMFSATVLSGYTCSAYGYFAGFGYGYDCTAVVSGGGGGGGGGSSSSYSLPVTTTTDVLTGVTRDLVVPLTLTSPMAIDGVPLRVSIATDISRTKYKTALQTLISNGLMNNMERVYPVRPITRGEFLKILARANKFTPVNTTHKFDDLSDSNDLAQYIYFGVSKGWVNATFKNFRTNDYITQGEVTKLINAIKGSADANTVVKLSQLLTRGKAAQDIFDAFLNTSN